MHALAWLVWKLAYAFLAECFVCWVKLLRFWLQKLVRVTCSGCGVLDAASVRFRSCCCSWNSRMQFWFAELAFLLHFYFVAGVCVQQLANCRWKQRLAAFMFGLDIASQFLLFSFSILISVNGHVHG